MKLGLLKEVYFIAKRVLLIIAVPIFFFASYWHVRKRVLTSMYLTTKKLGSNWSDNYLESQVAHNFRVIFWDRLYSVLVLLPVAILRRLVRRLISFEGTERISEIISAGKGALVFSCHIGPYYLIPLALALAGVKVTAVESYGIFWGGTVGRRVRRVNRLLGKDALEIVTVYDNMLLKKLRSRLLNGRVVFIMGDYHGGPGEKVPPVTFLGYHINPGRGIGWLHKATGAPVIPLVFEREQGRLCFRPPLQITPRESVGSVSQKVYQAVEREIIPVPGRWALWMDYHLMLASPKQ